MRSLHYSTSSVHMIWVKCLGQWTCRPERVVCICIATIVVIVCECGVVSGCCCVVTDWVCNCVEVAGCDCAKTSVSLRSSMCAGFRRLIDTVSLQPLRLIIKYLSVCLKAGYGPLYGGCRGLCIASCCMKTCSCFRFLWHKALALCDAKRYWRSFHMWHFNWLT